MADLAKRETTPKKKRPHIFFLGLSFASLILGFVYVNSIGFLTKNLATNVVGSAFLFSLVSFLSGIAALISYIVEPKESYKAIPFILIIFMILISAYFLAQALFIPAI